MGHEPGVIRLIFIRFLCHQAFWISLFKNGGLLIELNTLWGTQVQAESLLMMHSWKPCPKDTAGHFLHTPDTDRDTCRAPAHP